MQVAGAEKLLELQIDSKAFCSGAGASIHVLSDIALQLAAGSCVSLFGPSGCGKTSILRIAAGLDRDFEGKRWVAPSARLGMVFQEPRLLPWRTVEDNIRIVLEASDTVGDASEWLQRLDLVAQRRQFAGELSLGQARRVAMARALSIAPNLLLLDEPMASLDAEAAERLCDQLRGVIERDKVGVFLVTHNLDEAMRLSDRLVVLGGDTTSVLLEQKIAVPRARRDGATISGLVAELAERTAKARTRLPV
ncbi:MAG: ATP-binding cassette domain-containing protein [Pseudomonadota bacterium]